MSQLVHVLLSYYTNAIPIVSPETETQKQRPEISEL